MSIMSFLYRCALRCMPRAFRSRYADEMVATFNQRMQSGSLRVGATEIGDVFLTAIRLQTPRPVPRFIAGVAVTSVLLLIVNDRTAQQIDFRATDPAGAFTLSIRRGKPVAASLDGVNLPLNRLHQSGDSIRFLERDGKVLLSVAFDSEKGSIAWEARQGAR